MLARLKEYAEFLAIMVFFFGGVLWIYQTFAQKAELSAQALSLSERIAVSECMLRANINILSLQLQRELIVDELTKIKDQARPDAVLDRELLLHDLMEIRQKEGDAVQQLRDGHCL